MACSAARGGGIGAEIDAVKAGPASGIEEGAEVADCVGGYGVGEVEWGFFARRHAQDDVGGERRHGAVGRGLPPADVGGVAADAEDAVGGQRF